MLRAGWVLGVWKCGTYSPSYIPTYTTVFNPAIGFSSLLLPPPAHPSVQDLGPGRKARRRTGGWLWSDDSGAGPAGACGLIDLPPPHMFIPAVSHMFTPCRSRCSSCSTPWARNGPLSCMHGCVGQQRGSSLDSTPWFTHMYIHTFVHTHVHTRQVRGQQGGSDPVVPKTLAKSINSCKSFGATSDLAALERWMVRPSKDPPLRPFS